MTYGAARKSTAQISCYVDSNPNPTKFHWQFQAQNVVRSGSGGRKRADRTDVDDSKFSLEHDHSVLRHTAATEADYGTALCWAENSVGKQEAPCAFRIVKESEPDAIRKCAVTNVTGEVSVLPLNGDTK